MNIAVIGAGHVGEALAVGWAKAGHNVTLGVRNTGTVRARTLISAHENIKADSVGGAAGVAEVIVLAIPPSASSEVAGQLGDVIDKVIIDATNSVSSKPAGYQNVAEAIRALTGCRHVVKCFNTTGFENMANPRYGEASIDTFVAGKSEKGKAVARNLASDLGFASCYDFGGDEKIALLESLALCWINLAIMQGQGRNIAFKILIR